MSYMITSNTPWIEKYRPDCIDDIILSKENLTILSNIIKQKYFPNLLLYGPPGTGKTTTIINLIKEFNKQHNISNKNTLHLNASDERGVDIIRGQIYNFISSNIINHGNTCDENESNDLCCMKFVILDEADYMTKSAQVMLKMFMKRFNNVRFCIICNFISKIIPTVRQMSVSLVFMNHNKKELKKLFSRICVAENIEINNKNKKYFDFVIKKCDYDIRSMINALQSLAEDESKSEITNKRSTLYFWNSLLKPQRYSFLRTKVIKHLKSTNPDMTAFLTDFMVFFIQQNVRTDENYFEFVSNMKHLYNDKISNLNDKVSYFSTSLHNYNHNFMKTE